MILRCFLEAVTPHHCCQGKSPDGDKDRRQAETSAAKCSDEKEGEPPVGGVCKLFRGLVL